MPYNLTLTGASFGAGKFGNGLTGGYGLSPAPNLSMFPGNNSNRTYTVEGWGKTTDSGTIVLFSQNGMFYVDATGGKAGGQVYTSANNPITITTNVTVNDGVWHHYRLCVDGTAIASGGTGMALFVDGVKAWSSATAGGGDPSNSGYDTFGVGNLTNGSFVWPGAIDEIAIWSTVLSTTAFTPPTASYTGSEAGLIALYHLTADGTDTKGNNDAPVSGTVTVTVTSVTVSPSAPAVAGGATQQFTATVSGTGSPAQTVTWSATGGTINASGLFTAPAATASAQTITVTATSTVNTAKSGTATVTIAATGGTTPTVTSVTVSPSAPSVAGGGTQQFTAAVAGTNNPAQTVTWSANGGAINSSGMFTAPASTASAQTITVTATSTVNTAQSGTATVTVPASAVAPSNGNLDPSKVWFSPGNWNVEAAQATTVNPGASFRVVFAPGSALTLAFDMSVATGAAGAKPRLCYSVNGNIETEVDIAASVSIAVPTGTSGAARNELEVWFKSADASAGRWGALGAAVRLTGITGATTLAKPADRGPKWIAFGDSIVEGVNTNNNWYAATTNNDARLTWIFKGGKQAGVEMGIVGFGSQGLTTSGTGGVPPFPNTYNYYYAGAPRTFPADLAGIIINQGTNDGNGTQQTAIATSVLNSLLAAIPAQAKIVIIEPFNGSQATAWQAAKAACSAPSRVTYIDTTGWYDPTDTGDSGLHPNGYFGTLRAPDTATAIKNAAAGATATSLRTFSTTLYTDATTPAGSLTGLKIRCYNQDGSLAFGTDSGTSSASGVISVSGQSTAAAGASCLMTVRSPDHHWSNFVTVA